MRYSIIDLFLMAYGFATEPITFSKVIQSDNSSKTKLFVSINDWFASNYNSANEVIQMADKDEGIIIGKGSMEYSHRKISYLCYGGWIKYTIKVYIKENRYKVELTNFTHSVKSAHGAQCALGTITDAEEHTTKGWSKKANNAVWNDLKEKSNGYSNAIFMSLNEHTDKNNAQESQDDW